MRIGHGLEGCECLRRDDEKRFGWVEVARGFDEIGAVDVGNIAECDCTIAVISQCFIRHDRAEVGAADAYIDDIAYWLTGVALPFPTADAIGKICHLVKNGMNLRHYVLAVHDNRCPFGGPKSHMQHRAL